MALDDLGVGAAPTGTTTTKTPIKVPAGYKATKQKQVEYDALGRIIVPDGAPITDPNKEINRSDATMEIKSVHTEKVPGSHMEPTITSSDRLDKNGRIVGQTYWINGRHAERQTIKSRSGGPDTYKYYWDDGKEVDFNKVDKNKKVDTQDDKYVTSTDKGKARTETQTSSVDPLYFDGDQYRPASQPPETIAALQRKMIAAGVLPASYTTFGRWDDASAAAYEKILGYANAQGSTDDEIMDQWKKFGAADGPPAKKLVVKNPDEIAATVKEAAAKILGRSLAQSEVDQLVAGYQQLDRTQQEKSAAAESSVAMGVDASAPEPLSVDTYVSNKVRADHQGESQFMTGVDRMNTFYSMLGEAV